MNVTAATEREMTVINPADSTVLAGTLALPDGAPRAALVLATGSGTQNRDEEIMGMRPFKVISDTLAANGYAVLRLDDRGAGGSTSPDPEATTVTLAGDISCAVTRLESLFPNVPTGVLGHSEGGVIAIINAAENPACDFIITLAAPAWSGDSTVMSQARAIATATTGQWTMENFQRQFLAIAKSPLPTPVAMAAMDAVAITMPGYVAAQGMPEALHRSFAAMLSPWYREFMRLDPAQYIVRVNKPWLALNGSRDMQIVPAQLATIARLCPAAITVTLEGHNHMFQYCSSGLPDEYASCGQSPSDETLAVILQFLSGL